MRTEPAATTLVNLATNLYTDAPADQTFTVTLLGRPVRIHAHAQQWTWHEGDGQTQTTSSPGRRGSTDITHTYRRPGMVDLSVDITWSGTYEVPGAAAPLPVRGTATTIGRPSALRVDQARSAYQSGGG